MSSLMWVIIFVVILAFITIAISRICMCIESCSLQKHFGEYLKECHGENLQDSIQKVNMALKALKDAATKKEDQ